MTRFLLSSIIAINSLTACPIDASAELNSEQNYLNNPAHSSSYGNIEYPLTDSVKYVNRSSFYRNNAFFLSAGLGPAIGKINVSNNFRNNISYFGQALIMDFKVGYALSKNAVLHATYVSHFLNYPQSKKGDPMQRITIFYKSINESMLGLGLSLYSSKTPLFISGSIGTGKFAFRGENQLGDPIKTKNGFSMQLKSGFSWWLSKKVSLLVAASYGKTKSTYRTTEKLSSNRFGITINLSVN
jgi:hypothetical protein